MKRFSKQLERNFDLRVFDLHSDIFTDIAWRRKEGETNVFDRLHYPNLKKGNVRAIICVVWVEPKFKENRFKRFNEIVKYAMDDIAESKHINVCKSIEDMTDSSSQINMFLGIEGMSFIQDAVVPFNKDTLKAYFAELHRIGFRTGILAWNEANKFASGTGPTINNDAKGLTEEGRMIVSEMIERNWLIDVSHLDEQTFWDIYHLNDQSIFASHSNVFSLCPHERNLTDEQIKAIAKRDGIIGLNAFTNFIKDDASDLDDFIEHMEYIITLVGMDHVALGFDFMDYLATYDLGTSFPGVTTNLETISDVPELMKRLKKRGFSDDEIMSITYDNSYHYIKNIFKG